MILAFKIVRKIQKLLWFQGKEDEVSKHRSRIGVWREVKIG